MTGLLLTQIAVILVSLGMLLLCFIVQRVCKTVMNMQIAELQAQNEAVKND